MCSIQSANHILGHLVLADDIEQQTANLDTIWDWPDTALLAGGSHFLQISELLVHFVKAFAMIAEPLSHITMQNVTVTWTNESQTSFDRFKHTAWWL